LAWKCGTEDDLPYDHPFKNGPPLASGEPLEPINWTPKEILTDLWLDASDQSTITESGGDVSVWEDKSGNDNHATQVVGAEQPKTAIDTINGLNTITFDDVDDFMNLTSDIVTTPDYLCMGITNRPTVSGNDQIFVGSDDGASKYPFLWNGPNIYTKFDVFNLVGNENVDGVHILAGLRDSANDTWANFDGVAGTKVATTSPPTLTIAQVGLTDSGAGDFKHEGPMGEFVLAKDSSIDTTQKLEGYFAWKWGAVANLPVDHPYKDAAPRTTGNFPERPTVTNGNGDIVQNSSGADIHT